MATPGAIQRIAVQVYFQDRISLPQRDPSLDFRGNALHGANPLRACPECNEGVTIASFAVLHNLTFANPYAKVALTYLMSDSSHLIFCSSVRGAA